MKESKRLAPTNAATIKQSEIIIYNLASSVFKINKYLNIISVLARIV
jgi:hypothetical protein